VVRNLPLQASVIYQRKRSNLYLQQSMQRRRELKELVKLVESSSSNNPNQLQQRQRDFDNG